MKKEIELPKGTDLDEYLGHTFKLQTRDEASRKDAQYAEGILVKDEDNHYCIAHNVLRQQGHNMKKIYKKGYEYTWDINSNRHNIYIKRNDTHSVLLVIEEENELWLT